MIPTLLIRAVPYLLAVAVVAASHSVAYYFGASHTATEYDLQISKERTRAEQAIAAEMAERVRMEQAARDAEQRKQDEIERVRKDANDQIARATNDALSAVDSANRLLDAAKRKASRCAAAASASPAAGSAPTAAPGMVLADVLGRIDARAGELAKYADRAAIAGSACEVSYDALR